MSRRSDREGVPRCQETRLVRALPGDDWIVPHDTLAHRAWLRLGPTTGWPRWAWYLAPRGAGGAR